MDHAIAIVPIQDGMLCIEDKHSEFEVQLIVHLTDQTTPTGLYPCNVM